MMSVRAPGLLLPWTVPWSPLFRVSVTYLCIHILPWDLDLDLEEALGHFPETPQDPRFLCSPFNHSSPMIGDLKYIFNIFFNSQRDFSSHGWFRALDPPALAPRSPAAAGGQLLCTVHGDGYQLKCLHLPHHRRVAAALGRALTFPAEQVMNVRDLTAVIKQLQS